MSTQDRPNILLVMDDQHRFDYLGSAGADFLETPNLDRLAERGVRFTQCVTNCPVCAPARIALATGLQPVRMGSVNNSSYLPRSVTTYYQRLRDHGYRVGCVGKLDLAKPDGYNGRYGDRPCVFGFGFTHPEECEGKMHAGLKPTPQGPYNYWLQERGLLQAFHEDYLARKGNGWVRNSSHDSVLPTDAYEDTYIGRRAVEWLEQVPDDFPWHYFVSFVGPHDPFDPPTEYADRFRDADVPPAIEDDLSGKPAYLSHRHLGLSVEETAVTRRQYAAEIALLDEWVGRMVDALERRGMLENTIIAFTSDHGEMLGDHGMYTKSVPYEPSIRVPLIMAGPGIEQGKVSDALVELIDVNPTLCDLAGLPPQENIDARSLAPILHGETDAHRSEQISMYRTFRLVRTERYKYVESINDTPEIYDLENDPSELKNIYPEVSGDVRGDLRKRLTARFLEGQWRR